MPDTLTQCMNRDHDCCEDSTETLAEKITEVPLISQYQIEEESHSIFPDHNTGQKEDYTVSIEDDAERIKMLDSTTQHKDSISSSDDNTEQGNCSKIMGFIGQYILKPFEQCILWSIRSLCYYDECCDRSGCTCCHNKKKQKPQVAVINDSGIECMKPYAPFRSIEYCNSKLVEGSYEMPRNYSNNVTCKALYVQRKKSRPIANYYSTIFI